MAAGLEIINSYGSLLISADVPAVQFKRRYSVTVPAGAGVNRYVEFSVTNCTAPVLFVRPQAASGAARWFMLTYLPAAGTITARVWVMGSGGLGGGSTAAMAFDVYHFDMPDGSAGGAFGMKLYTVAGVCAFNSNEKLCQVDGALFDEPYDGEIYFDSGVVFEPAWKQITLPAARLPAVNMPGGYYREFTDHAAGIYRTYQTVAKIEGTQVTVWPQANILINDGAPQSPYDIIDRYTGSPGSMVIDVAGY